MSTQSQWELLLSHSVAEFEWRVNAFPDYEETHPQATLGDWNGGPPAGPGLSRPSSEGAVAVAFPGNRKIPPVPGWSGVQVHKEAAAKPRNLCGKNYLAAGLLLLL